MNLSKFYLITCFSFSCILFSSLRIGAQPELIWEHTYGGSKNESARSFLPTDDGGFVIMGSTESDDGDVTDYMGNSDIWMVKVDGQGKLQWQKTIGDINTELTPTFLATPDNGFLLCSNYREFQISSTHKALVIKVDELGNEQWRKEIGGSDEDRIYGMCRTNAGDGYVLTGYSESDDGAVPENKGGKDVWVFKIDHNGEVVWSNTFGGSEADISYSVIPDRSGGYVIVGETLSADGDITHHQGGFDLWAIKVDEFGEIVWQKTYGGSAGDRAFSVDQTNDDGFILAGETRSEDGDVSDLFHLADIWLVKLDSTGLLEWEKTLGGTYSEYARSVIQANDGNYIVAGTSGSNDGDASGNHSLNHDIWTIKINHDQEIIWQKMIGGVMADYGEKIYESPDDHLYVLGMTRSDDGDISNNQGWIDIWLVKLSENPTSEHSTQMPDSELELFPNPTAEMLEIQTNMEILSMKMFDVLGRQIEFESMSTDGKLINMSHLSDGVYIMYIKTKQGEIVRKIIKSG